MSGLSRDDIVRMVAEVGFHAMHGSKGELYALSYQHMEKFANLVAAAEREACADICDHEMDSAMNLGMKVAAGNCADKIRGRE